MTAEMREGPLGGGAPASSINSSSSACRFYYRAQIAAVRGDRDRAVELLRDAIAQGAVDPWDHLHSEPAFAALHGSRRSTSYFGRRAEIS